MLQSVIHRHNTQAVCGQLLVLEIPRDINTLVAGLSFAAQGYVVAEGSSWWGTFTAICRRLS